MPRDDEDLNDVRRAALVLRERDPSEAVRILRQVVRRGGDATALAHGALGEILLEDFDDVDGAAHHFRELLKVAPDLPAAELGLARSLSRQGLVQEAERAQGRAMVGLSRIFREAMHSSGTADEPEALEETLLTLLEVAVERRDLAAEARLNITPEPPLDDCFAWAEENRLFDDSEDPDDKDDWSRYLDLRALLLGFAQDRDGLSAFLERLGSLLALPKPVVDHARSLGFEAAGDAAAAADAARAALTGAPLTDAAPVSVLRTADLERARGDEAAARALLSEYRSIVASWPKEEAQPVLAEIDERLEATAGAPTLVRIGLRRKEG